MRRRLWFFVPFVLAITIVVASGAGEPQSSTGLTASTESSGSIPKVASDGSASSPEMQRLDRVFGGTWTTSENFAHNEFYPSGAEREGAARFTLATGGTSLIEEVHSDGSAGRLDFMVVIWWDNEAKIYNFFTCGNGGNNPCKIRGAAHWDGDSFVNGYELTIRGAKKNGRIPSRRSLQSHSRLSRQWNQPMTTVCNQ
jgi:hypothetical protein